VKPLVLSLRQRPDQRLDLSAFVPHRLAGKSVAEIERMDLATSRHRVDVGEVFRVRAGSPEQIRLEGACDRLDLIGHGMISGEMIVEGDVGAKAGRLMTGGRLTIRGDAGPWAASGMQGGHLEIIGSVGDRLGGPLAGEVAGMRGGVVVVGGNAGERGGDRLRRGTIIIQGSAGPYAGSRMLAGTLIVRRAVGALPGYLMRRGTIVCGAPDTVLSSTFVDCGIHHLIAMRLLATFVRSYNKQVAAVLDRPLRRFAGDMAALGKGEIFCPI
jgi:formylmethanofuran dehydrogenase subunit C